MKIWVGETRRTDWTAVSSTKRMFDVCLELLKFLINKYNVSVNNTTLHFIYNKNSTLLGRHVSTFIGSSSGPLGKQIQELSTFQCIVASQMLTARHWNIDSSWICFPTGPEDDLINVETCSPNNVLFSLYIKWSVVLLTNTLYLFIYLFVITFRDGKH